VTPEPVNYSGVAVRVARNDDPGWNRVKTPPTTAVALFGGATGYVQPGDR